MHIFTLSLENMAVYLAFFAAGMFFSQKKLVPENAGMSLSFLITNLFTPAICFNTFALRFTTAKIGEYTVMLLSGSAFMLISILVANIVRRFTPGNQLDKLTAHYGMVVPNYGNMGYPLVLALFGQEILSKFMMFGLMFNFYVFGYVMMQYMPAGTGRSAAFKKIFSAPIIMMLAGIAYGLSGLPYPNVIANFCTCAGNCLAPVSFLVVGLAMGKRPIAATLKEPRAYVLTGLRLLVLPALSIFGTYLLCGWTALTPEVLMIIGIYTALPMGTSTVIFAEAYGDSDNLGASCAVVSMLFALITLPAACILIEHLTLLL